MIKIVKKSIRINQINFKTNHVKKQYTQSKASRRIIEVSLGFPQSHREIPKEKKAKKKYRK